MSQKLNTNQPEKATDTVLSAVKIRQFNEQPAISTSVSLSEDGKWLISRVTIATIKPVSYYEAILEGLKEKKKE